MCLELRYRIRCRGPGLARFEGLRVQIADFQGFFYHVAFVPAVMVYRVLPVLVEGGEPTPALKRDNQLPPPGIHRLRRPGSASELLDLRDYLPGDPPKTIAWKVSARRDRLITKEYESEAPVRCTLFVDASHSVRVPSIHGKALGRLVEIAAAVLQANAGVRDLTGLCLFDDHESKTTCPDRSPAHVTQALQTLADAAALPPATARIDPDHLIPIACAFAREVYPHLMRPAVNDVPFWQEWLDSVPRYSRHRASLIRYLFRRKRDFYYRFSWAIPTLLLLADAALLLFHLFIHALPAQLLVLLWLASAGLSALSFFGGQALLMLTLLISDHHRRLARYRKQLAALFSMRYGLAPGGLSALLEDDDAFALLAQRFLGEHHVPYTLPLYDRDGCYLFASPAKVGVLASALLQAVGRGRDNELFVLLADLLELDDTLDPLVKAVRVAVSRHHQVVLVIPWPEGMRLPAPLPPLPSGERGRGEGDADDPSATLHVLLGRATTRRLHRAYHRLRQAFTRLGVPVVCAASDQPVPLILERLNRLRAAGRRR